MKFDSQAEYNSSYHIYVCICVCVYIGVCVCVCLFVCAHTHVRGRIYIYIYTRTHVWVRTHTCVYMYVHISNSQCHKARRYQVPFYKSLVWRDVGLNPSLPDHWRTLYLLGQPTKSSSYFMHARNMQSLSVRKLNSCHLQQFLTQKRYSFPGVWIKIENFAHLYGIKYSYSVLTVFINIMSHHQHGYPWPSPASGRFSRPHPVSAQSCCVYVLAGQPAFARPCEGVHRSTSLMSSSLHLQQCPACLILLTWLVFVMGVKWLYSCCFVGCCLQDFFNIAHSILV